MKNFVKKLVTFGTACALCVGMGSSLVACGGNSGDKIKIGVGLYQDSGPAVTATKAYLAGIADELNCEFTYVTLSQTDEAANKGHAQTLISQGCQGMILTMDSGTTSILEECKKAGVYVAGYLCDYEISYDTIKTNENFLGTVVDGSYTGTAWGQHIAERVIAEGYKNIGMIKFPEFAYPHQVEMDAAFREAIAEYNETAEAGNQITVQATTTNLNFAPLDSSYFSQNPNLDAIYAMCAGIDFVYPTMVSAGKTNIKLFTAGFSTADDTLNNFGTSGNGCIQELVFSNAEAITYPLVMLINKISGNEFTDNPTEAARVDSSQIIITNNEELNVVKQKSMYYTGKYANAFLTGKDVKALLAENGGTHAKLVETVQSMTIEDLKAL